jgi:hypothetical protein
MSAFTNIRNALVAGFRTGAFFSDANTAYENRTFTPGTAAWAAVHLMPNTPSATSIGVNGIDEHDGVFQVAIYYPINTGDGAANAKADAIAAVFKAGATFTSGGQAVVITRTGVGAGRNDAGWYRLTVSIYWRAKVNR